MSIFGKLFNKNNNSTKEKPVDESSINNYQQLLLDYVNNSKDHDRHSILYSHKLDDTEAGKKILKLKPDDSVGMVMMCINHPSELVSTIEREDVCRAIIVHNLLGRKLPFEIDQVQRLTTWLLGLEQEYGKWPWYISQEAAGIVSACENLKRSGQWDEPIEDSLKKLRQYLVPHRRIEGASETLDRIDMLLEDRTIPLSLGDAWSDAALSQLGGADKDTLASWIALLQQCLSASGAKPSAKWLKAAKALVETVGVAAFSQSCLEWFPLVDKLSS